MDGVQSPVSISEHICKRGLHFTEGRMAEIAGGEANKINVDKVMIVERSVPQGGIASQLDGQKNGIKAHVDPDISWDSLGRIKYRTREYQGHGEKLHDLADIAEENP